ncbi:hypothetical protein L798_03999 [Zootermopsis nevadensis]|uniref:Uncharacterized protein n=1 Tax=Zootermopsis nevadensis TaxID=136037 RepID=A0A067QFN9_ZOONE|nr:hypothetical protein L798_03999 [Zootermopsis nevadensis]
MFCGFPQFYIPFPPGTKSLLSPAKSDSAYSRCQDEIFQEELLVTFAAGGKCSKL